MVNKLDKQTIQAYYDSGYEVACKYREEGLKKHPDAIPTRGWFKDRMWPSAFEFWATWKFAHVDVSDLYVSELSGSERQRFLRREMSRLKNGLWMADPTWDSKSEEEQNLIREKYPWAPWVNMLSPNHYFLLNYCKIKTTDNTVIRPVYYRRDALFWDLQDCLEMRTLKGGLDYSRGTLFVFKARASKFSTSIVAKALRNALTQKNSGYSIGMAIDTQDKINGYFQKITEIYNSVPKWIQPQRPDGQEIRPEEKKAKEYASLSIKSWDEENGKMFPFASRIIVKGHSPKFWEDLRLSSMCIDEAGISDYPIGKLIDKSSACMFNSKMEQVGLCIVGGTSDENNEKNNPQFRAYQKNPKQYRGFIFFHGVQHSGDHDEFGWSAEEEIFKREVEDQERFRLSGDIQSYTRRRSIRPIRAEDCLYVEGASYIDTERCNRHLQSLAARVGNIDAEEPIIIQKGIFTQEFTNSMKIASRFVPKERGGWHIIEKPTEQFQEHRRDMPETYYVMGVDNVDLEISEERAEQVNEGLTRLSKTSAVVLNMSTGHPVAYYLYRHADPREDYHQILMGCLYYNCPALIERNKPKNIDYFKYYSTASYTAGYFSRWAMPTPELYGGNWKKMRKSSVEHGLHTGTAKKQWYENFIVPYMEEHTEKILLPGILEAVASWDIDDRKNVPDLGMAFMIAIMGRDAMIKEFMPLYSKKSGLSIGSVYRANRETYNNGFQSIYDRVDNPERAALRQQGTPTPAQFLAKL